MKKTALIAIFAGALMLLAWAATRILYSGRQTTQAVWSTAGRVFPVTTMLQADDLANKAWSAVNKGMYPEAGKAARQCLEIEPTNARALFALGAANFSRKDFAAAAKNFEQAEAIQSQPIFAKGLTVARLQMHDWDGAKTALMAAHRLHADMELLDAGVFYGNNDPAMAAAASKLVKSFPDQAICHYFVASALNMTGDFPASMRELENASQLDPGWALPVEMEGEFYDAYGDFQSALKWHTEAIKRQPELASPWRCRASVYAVKGQYSLAQSDLHQAIDRALDPIYRASCFSLLAEQELAAGDVAGAMRHLTEATIIDPQYGIRKCGGVQVWGQISVNRVVELYSQGVDLANEMDYANSLLKFQAAAALAPNWPLPILGVALENAALGDHAASVSACSRALTIEPRLGIGWLWKSDSLAKLGQASESLAALQHAGEDAPQWERPAEKKAGFQLAQRDFENCARELTVVLRRAPSAKCYYLRAKAREGLKDNAGALVDLGWSLAESETAEAYFERAGLLMAEKKKRDAIADYLAARRLADPKSEMEVQMEKILLPLVKTCPKCGGAGFFTKSEICPECGGSGSHAIGTAAMGRGKLGMAGALNNCMRCDATGWINTRYPCSACRGLGVIY